MSYIPVIQNARIAADAVTNDKVLNGTLTDTDFNAANVDGVAGVASLRTLGFGAQQAMPGDATLDQLGAPTGDLDLGGNSITNLADGVNPDDAATVAQVSAAAAGYDPKEAVLYTTTGDISLSGTGTQGNGTWPSALTAGDRILVKDQTDPIENGIYEAAAGAWTRSADFDGTPAAEVSNGAFTLVAATDGTDLVATGWVVTSADPIVVDTDPIAWTQITAPAFVPALNDLTDVDTTGVVTHAGLRYDGANWVDTANLRFDDGNTRIFYGASANVRGSGTVLQLNGTEITTNSKLTVTGGFTLSAGGVRTGATTSNGVLNLDFNTNNQNVVMDTSAGVGTVNLPAAPINGETWRIKRRGANALTVNGTGGILIDGGASFAIDDKEAFDFVYANGEWQVF